MGRTEHVQKSLNEFGPLFMIQVWSGFLDNLLAEVNLGLYSGVQSLPPIPGDMSGLRGGEVIALERYSSDILSLEVLATSVLASARECIHPCNQRLRELKTLLRLEGIHYLGAFDSILALNLENLRSIPARLKESADLLDAGFGWVKSLQGAVRIEHSNRQKVHPSRNRRMVLSYVPFALGSALLATMGLVLGTGQSTLGLLGAASLVQIAYLAVYFLVRRSHRRVDRNPSDAFVQMLTPLYVLTHTLCGLLMQANLVSLKEILHEKKS